MLEGVSRNRTASACLLLSLTLAAGCDPASEEAASPATSSGGATSLPTTYEPFSQGNLESQLLRVGAYEQIQAIRKGDSFTAADFGAGCDTWSGALTAPSDPTTMGSLYIETAGLSAKVEGRTDDHAYNAGEAIGAEIHAAICDALTAGSAVADSVDKDAVHGIAWYGQVVDKSLQRFFYASVYHELLQGTRQTWDEGAGYYGMSLDGKSASGIAKTAESRDANCGTTYARDIFDKLIEGRDILDRALTQAGKSGNEEALGTLPDDLVEVVSEIDRMLLEVFAISMTREWSGLAAGDEPAIKLIEGRSFFRILEPYVRSVDADLAAKMATEVDKDDPSAVDTAMLIEAVRTVFGIDVPALCTE